MVVGISIRTLTIPLSTSLPPSPSLVYFLSRFCFRISLLPPFSPYSFSHCQCPSFCLLSLFCSFSRGPCLPVALSWNFSRVVPSSSLILFSLLLRSHSSVEILFFSCLSSRLELSKLYYLLVSERREKRASTFFPFLIILLAIFLRLLLDLLVFPYSFLTYIVWRVNLCFSNW